MSSVDIDECAKSIHNCHLNSTCTNTNGTFLCMCNSGFTGNGTFCKGKFFKYVLITKIEELVRILTFVALIFMIVTLYYVGLDYVIL